MKICIYDGILESHVAESLARALRRRGHTVMETGRFGSGFKFADPTGDIAPHIANLHAAVEFGPDVVFVMRPASLPMSLLLELKRTGATLVAWFSDDPVLFDLSYGPIVSTYDIVLHCGNARVLQFYEDYFGRPTGVNFPFWTDHESFPRVWGTEPARSDLMFLGNVHDEVRRARYFELGKLVSTLRLHGATGTDYFGIAAGYLDADDEVVAAAASCRMALNIPQFFRDHKGLETWFTGLDGLGFFEYPSRVIQYMAMGLPTISVIPGGHEFTSFPEMLVAESISHADTLAQEVIADHDRLTALSEQTTARFDAHFSADARVLALEAVLADDSWRSLDAREREVWFTQFDASTVTAPSPDEEPTQRVEIARAAHNAAPAVILLSGDAQRETSRTAAVVEALGAGGVACTQLSLADSKAIVRHEAQDGCAYVIELADYLARRKNIPDNSVLLVCGLDAILSEQSTAALAERQMGAVFVDDTGQLKASRAAALASRYSLVATSSCELVWQMGNRGFTNIVYLPHFTRRDFATHLAAVAQPQPLLKVAYDDETQAVMAPAIADDIAPSAARKATYAELQGLTLPKLAAALRSEVILASAKGAKAFPRLSDLTPYVLQAAPWVFAARHSVWQRLYPLSRAAISVEKRGELATKMQWLADSPTARAAYTRKRSQALAEMAEAPDVLLDCVRRAHSAPVSPSAHLLSDGATVPATLHEQTGLAGGQPVELEVTAQIFDPDVANWNLEFSDGRRVLLSTAVRQQATYLVDSGATGKRLTVRAVYRGPSRPVPADLAVRLHGTFRPASRRVAGGPAGAWVIEMTDPATA